MVTERTGTKCEPWLTPQIHAAAVNIVMIEQVHATLMAADLVSLTVGASGQQKREVNPLLPYYDKLNRTLLAQFEALGLNYNTTPSKVTENTKAGCGEEDKLAQLLSAIK